MENFKMKEIRQKLVDNPVTLFLYYLVVNLAPVLYFVWFQPVNWVGKAVILLFPAGVFMLYLSQFRNSGKGFVFLFPMIFLHAFQITLFFLYGDPDVIGSDMFLNVVTTTPSEAGELLDSLPAAVATVIILYIPPLVLAVRQWIKKGLLPGDFRKKAIAFSIILTGVAAVISFWGRNKSEESFTFRDNVYPMDVVYNLGFAIHKIQKIKKYPKTSKDFSFHAVRHKTSAERQIIVLVIGETSRADNWQLYGYSRATNPNLETKKNLVLFRDAITENNATHKSVPIILSSNDATNFQKIYYRKGIFEAFREAGFTTICLSNQADNRSFIEYFTRDADIFKTIRTRDPVTKKFANPPDIELTKLMAREIAQNEGDLFIVLHSYGSHFNYYDRYPKGFGKFLPDHVREITRKEKQKLINAYDNSIAYTDYFLSQTIDVLENTGASSMLLFTSDHGEDLLDDSRGEFLHASPVPTYYQLRIAFFLWFSDEFKSDYPRKTAAAIINSQKPVSTNAVFHTLLDASEISATYFDSTKSLVSNRFRQEPRMYLNDHDKAIPFQKMNLQPEDFQMIRKNNIGE